MTKSQYGSVIQDSTTASIGVVVIVYSKAKHFGHISKGMCSQDAHLV